MEPRQTTTTQATQSLQTDHAVHIEPTPGTSHIDAVAEHEGHEHGSEHIHMPPPSLSPIILAVGITAAAFGLLFGPLVIAIGVIVILIGLGTWIYDEIKNASAA
jgi:hypothetical protein